MRLQCYSPDGRGVILAGMGGGGKEGPVRYIHEAVHRIRVDVIWESVSFLLHIRCLSN